MMTTPLEIWRAGFVFWTRAAEAQIEFAGQWMCAMGLCQREAQKAAGEALRAATVVPFAPNAISAPLPKGAAKGAGTAPGRPRSAPRAAASRGTSPRPSAR